MSAYDFFKLVHVVVAVSGLGLISAMALLSAQSKPLARESLLSMSRWGSAALALMFLSGALMDLLAGGAYHQTGWFRASGIALITTGGLLGYGRRTLAKSDGNATEQARKTVLGTSSAAGVLVALVAALMEAKPF